MARHEVKFERLEALRQSFSHANNTQDLSKKGDKMKIRVAGNKEAVQEQFFFSPHHLLLHLQEGEN